MSEEIIDPFFHYLLNKKCSTHIHYSFIYNIKWRNTNKQIDEESKAKINSDVLPLSWTWRIPASSATTTWVQRTSACWSADTASTTRWAAQRGGHILHTAPLTTPLSVQCIKSWLREQSTCPTCRDHALLPEEFPVLSGRRDHARLSDEFPPLTSRQRP